MKKLMFILLVAVFCVACDSNAPTMDNPKSVVIDSIMYTYYMKDLSGNYATSFCRDSMLVVYLDIENLSQKELQVSNDNMLGDCYKIPSEEWMQEISIGHAERDTASPIYVPLKQGIPVRKNCAYYLSDISAGKYYYQAPTKSIINGRDTITYDIPLSIKFEIK